jgi:hypothetical protein
MAVALVLTRRELLPWVYIYETVVAVSDSAFSMIDNYFQVFPACNHQQMV